MPLITSTPDPFSVSTLSTAWAYCALFTLNFADKTGRLVYDIHSNKTAAYSGGLPIKSVEIAITPTGTPAVYGQPELISPYVPPVYETNVIREPGTNGPDDLGETEQVLVTPAVDPVYSEAPLIRAAIPSFDELVVANQTAYGMLLSAVDTLALSQPEFADAHVEGQ